MLLLYLTISWCCGILFADYSSLPVWQWFILCGLSIISLAITKSSKKSGRIFLMLLLFEAGAAFKSLPGPSPEASSITLWNDQGVPLTISGRIISPPQCVDQNTEFILETENAVRGRHGELFETSGSIQVYTPLPGDYQYGDRVQVYGLPGTPPEYEGFSYREYLARDGIYTLLYSTGVRIISRSRFHFARQLMFRFRVHAHRTLRSLFPEPEAALLSGILLGIEGGISPDLMEDFQRTGTAHIIAISGFNITLVASIFINTLRKFLGMRLGLLLAALAVGIYTVFVGADAAVVRAALMVAVSLTARVLGRQNHAYNALAAAVFILTLMDREILYDAGFQLSASATLGLLVYGPRLEAWSRNGLNALFPGRDTAVLSSWIYEFVLLTFAAQLTTLPIMITCFHQVSIISLIVNPLILPAQPPIMIFGGLAVLSGMILHPAGYILSRTAWPFLRLTTGIVSYSAGSQFAVITLPGDQTMIMMLYYSILAAATLAFSKPEAAAFIKKNLKIPAGIALSSLGISCVLIWSTVATRPDELLTIDLIPVGDSSVALIQSPSGRNVLIGCGSSPVELSEAAGQRLPPMHQEIDWLLLGSTTRQIIQGFPGLVEQFEIKQVLVTATLNDPAFEDAVQLIRDHEIPVFDMQKGTILDFHDGTTLEIIEVGELGTAFLIHQDFFRFLITQGSDTDLIQSLVDRPEIQHVTAALLPESGNIALNPPEFLASLNPALVLLHVIPGECSGAPHEDVLNVLPDRTILRTDHHGWIRLTTDGRLLYIECEHQPGTD